MKKTIIALSLLIATTFAFAQNAATLKETAQKKTDELALQLSLTPEQKAKAYTICLDFFTQREKLLPIKEKSGKAAFQEKLMPIQKDGEAKLNAILNPEQQKKYAATKNQ